MPHKKNHVNSTSLYTRVSNTDV